MAWKEILTLSLAVIGAVLGTMNTWNAISQRRLRLSVRPAYAARIDTGHISFAIEVINLSTFAVTVNEVGIIYGRGKGKSPARGVVAQPILMDGGPWPRRLEPRESVSVYFDPASFGYRPEGLGKAYAKTSCGEIARGDSPALQQLRQLWLENFAN